MCIYRVLSILYTLWIGTKNLNIYNTKSTKNRVTLYKNHTQYSILKMCLSTQRILDDNIIVKFKLYDITKYKNLNFCNTIFMHVIS